MFFRSARRRTRSRSTSLAPPGEAALRNRSAVSSKKLPTIHPLILDGVIGGRIAPRTTLDPVILQSVQELSQALMSVGQNMAAAKQAGSQQMMQMMQQMMQSR